jgi:hypothetical protein
MSMSRVFTLALSSFAALAASTTLCAAGQAYTTRIEPRAFYGATVTLEEGVRVFRPLPVTRQVVINPGNKASVSVNYNEERTYNYSRSHNYDYSYGGASGGDGGHGGTAFYGNGAFGTPGVINGRGEPGGVFGGPPRRAGKPFGGKGGAKAH